MLVPMLAKTDTTDARWLQSAHTIVTSKSSCPSPVTSERRTDRPENGNGEAGISTRGVQRADPRLIRTGDQMVKT
jgi:hypothetical protein